MRSRPDYYYRQSAVIPFRQGACGIEVLVITTRKRRRWIVPKGIVEPDLTPGRSAAKEADEEAGVRGRVHAGPLGVYEYEKWGGTCRVEVYAMHVQQVMERWPEDFRSREWVDVPEAVRRIREAGLKRMIEALPLEIAESEQPADRP
jgi:phosphohistidine phosphatase